MLVLVTGLPGTGKSTMADAAGRILGAPVLAHDWAMSGLRPYRVLQAALDFMEPPGHRAVGWSVLGALARSQLRRGTSVVLDGVARQGELDGCRDLVDEEATSMVVVLTRCSDVEVHRSRVEGRRREIPNWYELDWPDVQRSRAHWPEVKGADLVLDAIEPLADNMARLNALLGRN